MHTLEDRLLSTLQIVRGGIPIYVQIRDQMLHALAAGLLAPGARMPTMRQVAVALKIDLNTVRHAYEELEREGAIELVHGSGSFVRERLAPRDRNADVDIIARQTIAAARTRGADPLAVAERIVALTNNPPGKRRSDSS
jgi:GntR family transcriptional regulator